MGKRTVVNANVTDVEKRREPSKHYVYIIHVTWSDGSVNVIYRRYSTFFDFQVKLLNQFPEEAGANDPSARCIPFLPGKKLFGRSHIREVAVKRLQPLDEYCQKLVKLTSKISDSKSVIQFFTPTQEDISPPAADGESRRGKEIDSISEPIQAEQYLVVADYKRQQKNEVDLIAGDLVEVFEKNDNGWWFVTVNDQHGWAPGTFLQKPDGAEEEETLIPGNNESYITNNAYKGLADDEITFETGVVVTVLQKTLDGWWRVSYQGKQGWAPATFLQIYKGPAGVTPKPPTQKVGNIMQLKNSDWSSNRPKPKPSPSPGIGSRSGGGAGVRPPQPKPQLGSEEDDSGGIYENYEFPVESKPTPPRRSTVRKSARRGATRNKRAKLSHYTIADFQGATGEGSLSFRSGVKVDVLEETDRGWWFVIINGQEGWAPSNYIEKREVSTRQSEHPNGKPPLGSLDEETGEQSDLFPVRCKFGGDGAFKPFIKSGKGMPPPVDRSNSPSVQRSAGAGGAIDMVSQLKKQFDKSSLNEKQNPSPPKAAKPSHQPFCDRDALYLTTSSYVNEENDGLSFQEGQKVEVIKKDDSGWWLVRIGIQEGWAPSTFLEKV